MPTACDRIAAPSAEATSSASSASTAASTAARASASTCPPVLQPSRVNGSRSTSPPPASSTVDACPPDTPSPSKGTVGSSTDAATSSTSAAPSSGDTAGSSEGAATSPADAVASSANAATSSTGAATPSEGSVASSQRHWHVHDGVAWLTNLVFGLLSSRPIVDHPSRCARSFNPTSEIPEEPS